MQVKCGLVKYGVPTLGFKNPSFRDQGRLCWPSARPALYTSRREGQTQWCNLKLSTVIWHKKLVSYLNETSNVLKSHLGVDHISSTRAGWLWRNTLTLMNTVSLSIYHLNNWSKMIKQMCALWCFDVAAAGCKKDKKRSWALRLNINLFSTRSQCWNPVFLLTGLRSNRSLCSSYWGIKSTYYLSLSLFFFCSTEKITVERRLKLQNL